jgi:alpha-1,3-rhamnosyl/mannosyltransferase
LANALVFPSIYEGFGIPVLEAMASNIPVALSDIPVFREITEGKGAYFDPYDSEAMAYVLSNVICCSTERNRLVNYGRSRIVDFSFSSLSAKLANIYKEVS